jgi:hypothetical protein
MAEVEVCKVRTGASAKGEKEAARPAFTAPTALEEPPQAPSEGDDGELPDTYVTFSWTLWS